MDANFIRRTVVVGVDGSHSALRAVRWGAAEAARRRTPLRLVIAFGWMVHHVAADQVAEAILAVVRTSGGPASSEERHSKLQASAGDVNEAA